MTILVNKKLVFLFTFFTIVLLIRNINSSEFSIEQTTYTTKLTATEVKEYEEWIEFKNSFKRKDGFLDTLPRTFQPQTDEYYEGLFKFNIIFLILGGVLTLIVISYCILRIGFRKCIGPLSMKNINKGYKVSTWILIVLSLIAFTVIYLVIIIPSFNLG